MPEPTIDMVMQGGDSTQYQMLHIASDTAARAKSLYDDINQADYKAAQTEIGAIQENLEFIRMALDLV